MIPLRYVLDLKIPIKTADGQEIIDLAAPSMKKGVDVKVLNYVLVRKDEEMRPDMLTQRYYGDMTNTEMLMKMNGVSNPFSIQEGDLMVITDPVSGRIAMTNNLIISKGDVRKQYFQPEKEGKPDPRLKTFEKRQRVQPNVKKSGPALPPNYANPGDKEITIEGGKIVFGGSISGSGEGAQDMPLEKMKFLQNLQKNPDVLNLKKKTAAIKLSDSSVINAGPEGNKLNNSSGIPNSAASPNALGTGASGNGVPNSGLSKAQLDKLAAEKAKKDKLALDLLKKVNLSKSELISKLIKDLYGKV
jgi:hypothetical protein